METYTKKIHQGHNIKRIRESRGWSQEGLGKDLGLSQQSISHYEMMQVVDTNMLKRFSTALNVPIDLIANMEDDFATFIVENNKFESSASGAVNNGVVSGDNIINNNPLEKVTELYEQLLKTERDHIIELRAEITELRKRLAM